jgi:hypothetical protein
VHGIFLEELRQQQQPLQQTPQIRVKEWQKINVNQMRVFGTQNKTRVWVPNKKIRGIHSGSGSGSRFLRTMVICLVNKNLSEFKLRRFKLHFRQDITTLPTLCPKQLLILSKDH